MHTINIKSNTRSQMIDITRNIQKAVDELQLEEGAVVVFVPHTTAAVTINEKADPSVRKDIVNRLASLIPWEAGYEHLEGNSAAHIKATLCGPAETIIVENGQLVLGRWQTIFFCEFDGPRTRKVFIKAV